MAAASIALEAYQGENYVGTGTHQVSSTDTTGVDIAGWTIVFTLKRRKSDPSAILNVTAALVTPASGIYSITLTPAQLNALKPGDYHCDIQRTNSGARAVMAIGLFTVIDPVRRAA